MVPSTKVLDRQKPKPTDAKSSSGNRAGSTQPGNKTVDPDLLPTTQNSPRPVTPLCPGTHTPDAAVPTTPPAGQATPTCPTSLQARSSFRPDRTPALGQHFLASGSSPGLSSAPGLAEVSPGEPPQHPRAEGGAPSRHLVTSGGFCNGCVSTSHARQWTCQGREATSGTQGLHGAPHRPGIEL